MLFLLLQSESSASDTIIERGRLGTRKFHKALKAHLIKPKPKHGSVLDGNQKRVYSPLSMALHDQPGKYKVSGVRDW